MAEILLADIGATNCRFAVIGADGRPARMIKLRDNEVPTLQAGIAGYLEETGARPRAGVLAIAGPIDGDAVKIGTFDLGPDVLKAVINGEIGFAVDQQPYLQGYLPIETLALKARYGIFPSQGDVVATGPHFVTRGDAAQALELSERSIR